MLLHEVNKINEELANIILSLDTETINKLSEYCQLQAVPDNFPFAKKANLFFFLNPDHFLIEQIGPDVMTFTHVEIDPKIGESIPQLLDIYKKMACSNSTTPCSIYCNGRNGRFCN